MFSRIVSITLAVILLWSGFATQEQVISLASSNTEQAEGGQTGEGPQHLHDGSVDDHHLDDQPAQAHAEGALDMPALIPAVPHTGTPAMKVSRAWSNSVADWGSLFLDGPQRPPRATPFVA